MLIAINLCYAAILWRIQKLAIMKSLDFAAMENIQGGGGCSSSCNPCCGGLSLAVAVAVSLGCFLGIGVGIGIKL